MLLCPDVRSSANNLCEHFCRYRGFLFVMSKAQCAVEKEERWVTQGGAEELMSWLAVTIFSMAPVAAFRGRFNL
jgi:hypothetical protein